MTSTDSREDPFLVQVAERVESSHRLDRLDPLLGRVAGALVASPGRRDLLHGRWLGHAVHPLLTDLPLGVWTSANLLDLLNRGRSTRAAEQLLGIGVVAAVPTVVTGLAEWHETDGAARRVGVLHAGLNAVGLSLFTASWVARRRGRGRLGVVLGLCASGTAGAGGFLGGHLTSARKVSSRHPAFAPP